MSFDHLGTFNASQLARLAAFARAQVADIDARILHLTAERIRIGSIGYRYDKGDVVAYQANPSDSYIGKLLSAYEALGGDPIYDLQIRQKDTQALFLMRADETQPARRLSDGRVVGSEGLADAPSAVLVQQLKSWMAEAVQYKRDSLERKIRSALDYSDQLADEVKLLQIMKQEKETSGSVENILDQLKQLIEDRTYRAIADDKGKDPNGLMTYSPFSPMEPGPKRAAEDYGRTLDGYVVPEEPKV